MYSVYLVLKERTKFVPVAWKRYQEWNKPALVLYLCARMVERDTEMQDAEEHILVKEIYK